jgi:poly-gamma-glutamate synthase PgsB/CapB
MLVIALATLLFLLWLVLESRAHDRRRAFLPFCIAVTGTRGKSGVVRLLTAVLRESGRRTMARTSGSRPMILLPDGSEREIRRRGSASIIEQRSVVREAARQGVDVLVAEIMSLRPECHRIEARTLLRPDQVVLTNVRCDHLEEMGQTEEEIAGILALDLPPGATLFVPEAEQWEIFRRTAGEGGGRLVSVPAGSADWLEDPADEPVPGLPLHFSENLELVCAVAAELGIERAVIRRGLARAEPDLGSLGIWRWSPDPARTVWLVNAFAANDPDSTARVLTRVRDLLSPAAGGVTGLLSLRPDRGERTRQWVAALSGEFASSFSDLWLCGLHARAVRARLGRGRLLTAGDPVRMTRTATADLPDGGILFGCGNIGGPGELLVEYWRTVGEPFGAVTGVSHGL